MKKNFSLLILILICMGWAESQTISIKGKYKGQPLTIKAQRAPGGDIIETFNYAPLTNLENEVKQLKKQKEDLESKIKKLQSENAKTTGDGNKANELSAENARLQRQNEQLTSENAKLRGQVRPGPNNTGSNGGDIEKLQQELQKINAKLDEKERAFAEAQKNITELEKQLSSSSGLSDSQKDKQIAELTAQKEELEEKLRILGMCWNTDYISFQMDFGFSFMKNSLTKQDFWGRGSAGAQQFEISYTHYLSDDSPIAFRAGLGLGLYHGNGAFASMKDTIEKLKDDDGDTYHAYYSFRDVSEEVTLSYLEIPLLLHIGNSCTNQGVQAWGEVGFKIGLNVGTSFTGNGKYTLQNFYPKWNVLVHDIPELGLVTDESLYSENMEHEVNTLVLWGQLAGGIMVPLTDQIHFNAGVRMGYTFSTIAKEAENPNNYKYILGKSNLLAGSGNRIFTIGMDLGIVYAF